MGGWCGGMMQGLYGGLCEIGAGIYMGVYVGVDADFTRGLFIPQKEKKKSVSS